MSRSTTKAATAVAALIGFGVPALAQEPGSRTTREFVQAAGESDAFEIAEAQTALAQSRDPAVLAFARRMIADHQATSRALAVAMEQVGLAPPPMQVGAGLAPFLAALQSARGGDFDRLYWKQQAYAHRAALVTAERYAADGDTPALRQAAALTVPVIRSHLAMAEKMGAMTGPS